MRYNESMDTPTNVQVRQATVADIEPLSSLFDSYRQFYGMPSDIVLARTFLLERFEHQQSVIFIAVTHTNEAVGFVQLYPSFSSVSAARTFILNDLFVVSEVRRSGVAGNLIKAAKNYGHSVGAVRLSLSTAVDNEVAQALYISHGWATDTKFVVFHLPLPS